jgi:hypothetical protein
MMQAVPINLIRWHYLWYVAAALAIMIAAIATHYLWFLNFVHVFCGLLWTGIDLFMGFVLGPILRVVDIAARKAVLLRLTPRTLFLMPTLAIITGTTGWYLAEDMGFTAISWPQYAWVAASLVLVILMTIQGIGYLLPTNFRVCLELQKDNRSGRRKELTGPSDRDFFVGALAPPRVYIHHEIDVAVRIGGRIGGNSVDGAPDLTNEDLAFRRRKRADIVDQRAEQPVAKRHEIV